MPNRFMVERDVLLAELRDEIGENQFEKLTSLIELQDHINESITKRRTILRSLKLFLTPSHYRQASICLDLTELMETPDRLTVLENQAIINYLTENPVDFTQWLSPQNALEFMVLHNKENMAFGLEPTWSDDYITQFKETHNLY